MIKAAWMEAGDLSPGPEGPWPAGFTPAEISRARRFQRPERRAQYVAGHRLLRVLAGALLGLSPESIALTAEGAPALWDPAIQDPSSPAPGDRPGCDPAPRLWLSLSHSGAYVAAAASDEGPVGIDLERADQDRDWAALASGLHWTAPEAATRAGFLRLWTRREAEYKAGLPPGAGYAASRDAFGFFLTLVSSSASRVDWQIL